MKIKMTLLSDTIFGNGMSVPGAEDISVLTDEYGFPYFKGGTMKGIFREELERLLEFQGKKNAERILAELLGIRSGASVEDDAEEEEKYGNDLSEERKIIFSDFRLSENVRRTIRKELENSKQEEILSIFSNVRTFTKMNDEGIVKEGSLRMARCVNKGLVFYSEIKCAEEDKEMVKEVLGMIKYIGTMRNRGFGSVKLEEVKGA